MNDTPLYRTRVRQERIEIFMYDIRVQKYRKVLSVQARPVLPKITRRWV